MNRNIWKGIGAGFSIAALSLSTMAVELMEKTISLKGWLGKDQGELMFSESAHGMTLTGSREAECDYANYASCDQGESHELTDAPVVTQAATINEPGFYQFSEVGQSKDYILSTKLFPGRRNHQVVTFQDKLWVIGGESHDLSMLNDIWFSTNGYTWAQKTPSAGFTARYHHQALKFNDKLWVFGGDENNGNGYLSEIWFSSDGSNWEQQTPDIALTLTHFTRATTFDNKIWLLDFSETDSAIYSSADGATWSSFVMPEDLESLSRPLVIGYNGKLFVFGTRSNDLELWSSLDGVDWVLEKDQVTSVSAGDGAESAFIFNEKLCFILTAPGRDLYCSLVGDINSWTRETVGELDDFDVANLGLLDDTLWILGNRANLPVTEIPPFLYSKTGDFWIEKKVGDASYLPQDPEVITFGSELIAAGRGLEGWMYISEDGVEWRKQWFNLGFSVPNKDYRLHSVLDTVMYLELSEGEKRTLISQTITDGGSWQQGATDLTMDSRNNYASVVFDNKLWVIGGYNTEYNRHNQDDLLSDVWSSEDGINWTEVTANAAFEGQSHHQVISAAGKMWLLENVSNAIWSSEDGETWTQVASTSVTPAREFPGFTSYKGKLWIIGGETFNDIWSSVDGITWTREIEHAEFPPVSDHKLVTLDERLYMVGGESQGSPMDYVWSTNDGVVWGQAYSDSLTVKTLGYDLTASLVGGDGTVDVLTPIVARGTRGKIELDINYYYDVKSVSGCDGELDEKEEIFLTEPLKADCSLLVDLKKVLFDLHAGVNNGNYASVFPSYARVDIGESQTFDINLKRNDVEIKSITGCGGVLEGLNYKVDNAQEDCQIDIVVDLNESTDTGTGSDTSDDTNNQNDGESGKDDASTGNQSNVDENNEQASGAGVMNLFLSLMLLMGLFRPSRQYF